MGMTHNIEKKAIGRFRYYKWSVFKDGKKFRSGYALAVSKANDNVIYYKYLKER